jgi:hypothetical protein
MPVTDAGSVGTGEFIALDHPEANPLEVGLLVGAVLDLGPPLPVDRGDLEWGRSLGFEAARRDDRGKSSEVEETARRRPGGEV